MESKFIYNVHENDDSFNQTEENEDENDNENFWIPKPIQFVKASESEGNEMNSTGNDRKKIQQKRNRSEGHIVREYYQNLIQSERNTKKLKKKRKGKEKENKKPKEYDNENGNMREREVIIISSEDEDDSVIELSSPPSLPLSSPPSPLEVDKFFCRICNDWFNIDSFLDHPNSTLHLFNSSSNTSRSIFWGIPESNAGFQMLKHKLGWTADCGLGIDSQGRLFPIKTRVKNDRLGLGNKPRCPLRITHVQGGNVRGQEFSGITSSLSSSKRNIGK